MSGTVLVTGSSGFIGQHVPSLLQALNYDEIHLVSRNPGKTPTAPLGKSIFQHHCSLLEKSNVQSLLKEIQPSHLLHLAWDVEHGKFWSSTNNLQWVAASLNLTRSFLEAGGQRAVFAGTCAEYDWNYGYCREGVTPLNPNTLYGVCKHALHEMVRQTFKDAGCSYAWGRLFLLFGPDEFSKRLVPSVIKSLLTNQFAACSSGEQIRDFLYTMDAADAFVTLLGSSVQGPVNICSGKPVPISSLVLQLGQLLGREDLLQLGKLPTRPDDPPFLVGDVQKLQKEVGWSPKYSLQKRLQESIDWWKTQI